MPRDQRLYMTFPIDFWMHPKIEPLSDAAFRVFVEMNGYSRMQLLDGRIPRTYADRKWRKRAISELCANHPERPSLSVDGDDYVIWNYAEHQSTAADIEGLRAKRAAAGAKGGRSKALASATAKTKQELANGKQNLAETETETEELPEGSSLPPKPPTGGRGERIPEPFILTGDMRAWAAAETPGLDVDAETRAFVDYWRGVPGARGRKLDWPATWRNRLRDMAGRQRGATPRPLTRTEQNMTVVERIAAREAATDQQKGISV